MKFSIILPVYNVEKYLLECIESILCQTIKDYEIILVDDGSNDGSPALCDKLAEKYEFVKVIHKPNGGQSDARNVGTEAATGEYIIYIDSDDFLLRNDFLEKVDEKIRTGADLIFYKYQKYFDSSKLLEDCGYSYSTAMAKNDYAGKIAALVKADAFYGMAWIKAIKRNIIQKNNIEFEVGLLGEDMDWNYHIIFKSTSIEFIDESFIAYRQREGSTTSTQRIKNLTDFIYILEKWSKKIETLIKNKELKIALFGSLAKYYSNLLVVYSRLADSKKTEYIPRIKKLDWLLEYSMSKRPQTIAKLYKIIGFHLTILAIKIMDRIK